MCIGCLQDGHECAIDGEEARSDVDDDGNLEGLFASSQSDEASAPLPRRRGWVQLLFAFMVGTKEKRGMCNPKQREERLSPPRPSFPPHMHTHTSPPLSPPRDSPTINQLTPTPSDVHNETHIFSVKV